MENDQSPAPASPSAPKTDKRAAAAKAAEARNAQAQQLLFFSKVAALEGEAIGAVERFFKGVSATLHLGGDAEEGRLAFMKVAAELQPLLAMASAGMKAQAEQLMADANG